MATEEKPSAENTQTPEGSDEMHVFEKMIDFTYAATTKIPLGGQLAKEVLDKYDTKERAKKVSHKYFEPLFPVPKIKKKS